MCSDYAALGAVSDLDFTQPNVPVHGPVAHEAVKRAFKTGGLIFLKTKVADPGKAITAEQAVQQVLRLACRQQHGKADQRQAGARKVQAAAG